MKFNCQILSTDGIHHADTIRALGSAWGKEMFEVGGFLSDNHAMINKFIQAQQSMPNNEWVGEYILFLAATLESFCALSDEYAQESLVKNV